MMAYEPRDNSGTLFGNDRKSSDKAPDWRGDCLVNGVKMRMSAWRKQGKRGEFISIAFELPREGQNQNDAPQQSRPATQRELEEFGL